METSAGDSGRREREAAADAMLADSILADSSVLAGGRGGGDGGAGREAEMFYPADGR